MSGSFVRSFVDRHAQVCAKQLADSWEPWEGDCFCGKVAVTGWCDRCTECAIDSIWSNEEDFGGTSEHVMDHFNVVGSGRWARIVEEVVFATLRLQSALWRAQEQEVTR